MAEDELALFRASMADVVPLKADVTVNLCNDMRREAQRAKQAQTKRREIVSLLSLDFSEITPVEPDEIVSFKHQGVQSQVFKLFRQGKYPMQASLALKDLGVSLAREALYDFILQSQNNDLRNLLIIHGTGVNNKPFPALLKSCLVQWLLQLDGVIGYHSATRALGGSGAMMVMLSKSDNARLNTRELTKKGANSR
ncbi:DNA endonuclease SmrA [Shewanella psychrotolerans]|uniref:DNA endonuclease SmrA n=1 Tax=Shewanella psychrotolerans TaxID=2864206 RepID=UPI001C65DEB1|nr:DNA endonuclease SmrA [Shewanella psychrotolerans]QYJ99906.1 DNA endonuclease SmrA [Shewanella psychrotolerans]